MKNLKIRSKLLVVFGMIIALFVMALALAIAGLNASGTQFGDFYSYTYPMSKTTLEVRRGIQTAIKGLSMSMLTEDEQEIQTYLSQTEEEMQHVKTNLEYLEKSFRGDTSRIKEALQMLETARGYRLEVQELSLENRNSEAGEKFFSMYVPEMQKIQELVIAMDENTDILADTTYESSQTVQALTVVLVMVAGVVALVIAVLLIGYLTRSLTKPIYEIEAAAVSMANGDLKATVAYTSEDELGSLSENMRLMTARISDYMEKITDALVQLSDGDLNVKHQDAFLGDFHPVQLAVRKLVGSLDMTLTQINQAADQVNAGSNQVSSGAQSLSYGTTQQASSIEELAATITSISSQVTDMAEHAAQARIEAEQAGSEVDVCNEEMKNMINAMSEISHKSGEIGKIIKTIEDIAFQTNILALNAAVEAARAGEAGKGFAVVADEVRNLASKSAEASKTTSSLIEGTVIAVDRGNAIVNETAATLLRVVESSKTTVGLVEKIADAAEEEAMSVTQVTQGVDQIASVVQNNSATAEESAAASEELSGQAQILRNLVSQFKLIGANKA